MKTVIEMAHEVWSAGGVYIGPPEKSLAQFAELVRADEREACAKVCYELPWKDMGHIPSNLAFAAAIRARSNT